MISLTTYGYSIQRGSVLRGSEKERDETEQILEAEHRQPYEGREEGRIDIGYRTGMGTHIIVELKRSTVSVPVDDLTKQVRKYRDGARKLRPDRFQELAAGNHLRRWQASSRMGWAHRAGACRMPSRMLAPG